MTPRLGLLLCVVLAGCASHYAYVPTTNASANMQGRVAAAYPIPPNAPHGNLWIASYGLTEVSPRDNPDQELRALHLRVVIANNGSAPWTFDTRDQQLDLRGLGTVAPAFASADNGASRPPLVTIEPGGKRVVDLFFLLPPDAQHEEQIPEFDALWRVNTDAGLIAERTPFERLSVEPDEGAYDAWDYGPDYYWAGPYWMNPLFPYDVPPAFFAGGVVIHRGPHFGRGFHGAGFGRGGGFRGGRFRGGPSGPGGARGGGGRR